MLLSGQLKIAENFGNVRLFFSSFGPATSAPKIPSSSLKKIKYVLKRGREERGVKHASSGGGSSRPTPLLRSPSAKPYETTRAIHHHKSPQGQFAASSSPRAGGNYVLHKSPRSTSTEGSKACARTNMRASSQRKETKLAAGPSVVQQASAIGSNMKGEPLPTDGHGRNNLSRQETKLGVDLLVSDRRAEENSLKAQAVTIVSGVVKKEKARKRSRDDAGSVGPEDSGGNKKGKNIRGIETGPSRDGRESYGKLEGSSIHTEIGRGQIDRPESQRRDVGVLRTLNLHSAAAQQPTVDVSSPNLEFPRLLGDLQELAADPFHAIERNAPSAVLQVFCKFRSHVYQKSLHPPESEHDMAKLQATRVTVARSLLEPGSGNANMAFGKEAKDHREPSSSALKLLKPKPKPDDPKKSGRKRGPSDGQEQLNVKKMKKMNQINELALGKEARISPRKPEGQLRHQKEPSTATVKASAASAKPNNKGTETVKKQKTPPPPLPSSPTALVLKFSLGMPLPSVAKLKARLAVFGPLVKDSTRVYWKTNSCRVVFEHKPHAEAALNYSRKNDLLLGPLQCYIRELDPATLKPLSNPRKLPPPQSHPSGGPLPRPGTGSQPRAFPYQQQRGPMVQLKSILKKPSDVGGGSVRDSARETPQRVTFILDGRDNKVEPPMVPTASHGSGGSYAAGSSSSLPLMDPITSKNPKSSGLLPLPAPPLHSTLLNPPRAMDKQRVLPPPPLPPYIPPPPRVADGSFPSISLPPRPPPPTHVVGVPLPPPSQLPRIMDRFEAGCPGPAQFNQSQLHHNEQHAVIEGRNKPDISNQMLILLRRCSDIVTNIKSSLGYLPYHPL